MPIHSPHRYRASRFLTATLIALSVAISAGLLFSAYGVLLIDAGRQLVAEVRAAWQS